MPKGEKTGLGRALVKHHNQMVQESKDKGKYYRNQQKKVLESVTEVSDIEAVIEQADEANRLFSTLHPPGKLPISLDSASNTIEMTAEEKREQQKKEEALHASSLRIPRRPPWNTKMTVEELDDNERRAFLEWRRTLARLEDNENLVLTPFEKNLDIWRQLWRVLERSDLLVMVVDARDPLFYRCHDLEAYAREIDEHKRTLLLVNKADLLPVFVREQWAEYFHQHGILFVFWSAKAASAALEGKSLNPPNSQQDSADADTKIYGQDELLARLQSEAEEIVSARRGSRSNNKTSSNIDPDNGQGVMVGFVGYPNVGKSSTINALVGEKRTGVTSTPGKTKHFQTLIISEKFTLCDCPGLVFPSFTSSRYEMIASGVLPIDRMTEHREAVQVVANRVPRSVIENVYRIALPKPKPYEPQSRTPLAAELLRTYCASRGYVAARGLPDETRAARQILKDYIDGKLTHFELPPGTSDNEDDSDDAEEGIASPEMKDSYSDSDEEPSVSEHHGGSHLAILLDNLKSFNKDDVLASSKVAVEQNPSDSNVEPSLSEHNGGTHFADVLDNLRSFDMDNGFPSSEEAGKQKPSKAPHKQHKKPQRKKDRSWRVRGGDGDGDEMPVVRVFQRPAVP